MGNWNGSGVNQTKYKQSPHYSGQSCQCLIAQFITGWMFFMTPNLHDTQPTVSEHLTAINGKVKFKYIIIIIS